jgi:hypothetical protein
LHASFKTSCSSGVGLRFAYAKDFLGEVAYALAYETIGGRPLSELRALINDAFIAAPCFQTSKLYQTKRPQTLIKGQQRLMALTTYLPRCLMVSSYIAVLCRTLFDLECQ